MQYKFILMYLSFKKLSSAQRRAPPGGTGELRSQSAGNILHSGSRQDAPKTLTRRPKKLSNLPRDAPLTPQDGPKTLPRRPQDGPRRPKTPQAAPRPLQDAPQPPKTTPRQRFWDDFRESLEDFWKIFWKRLPPDLPPRTYCPKK